MTLGYGAGPLASEPVHEKLKHFRSLGVVPSVVGLGRVCVEVIQLPLVRERFGAVDVARYTRAGQVTFTWFGPGGRVVEAANDLPETSTTTGHITRRNTSHDRFEVGGHVRWDLDSQWRRLFLNAAEAAGDGAGTGVALWHVVSGYRIHRPARLRLCTCNNGHEVTPRKRVEFGEVRLQLLGGRRHTNSGGAEQRGDQIDVGGRRIINDPCCCCRGTDARDCERDAGGLVIEVEPFLM